MSLISKIQNLDIIYLPNTAREAVWLDDVIDVLKEYPSSISGTLENEEKILYWARQLEGKKLTLQELIDNATWLLENVK